MTVGLSEDFLQRLERAHVYERSDARPTAREAAARALPKTGTKRMRVFEYIADRGEHGATDDEIAAGLPLPLNSVRPRRLELLEDDLIRDAGVRRPTPGGNPAIVWVVA